MALGAPRIWRDHLWRQPFGAAALLAGAVPSPARRRRLLGNLTRSRAAGRRRRGATCCVPRGPQPHTRTAAAEDGPPARADTEQSSAVPFDRWGHLQERHSAAVLVFLGYPSRSRPIRNVRGRPHGGARLTSRLADGVRRDDHRHVDEARLASSRRVGLAEPTAALRRFRYGPVMRERDRCCGRSPSGARARECGRPEHRRSPAGPRRSRPRPPRASRRRRARWKAPCGAGARRRRANCSVQVHGWLARISRTAD